MRPTRVQKTDANGDKMIDPQTGDDLVLDDDFD